MSKSKRVLHLIDSGGVYGIERMLLALLPALQSRGFDVALGCFGTSGEATGAVGDRMSGAGVSTYFFDFETRGHLRGSIALFRHLARERWDIVHTHGYKATIVAGALARMHSPVHAVTYHGEASKAVGLDRHIAIETRFLRRASATVAVSGPIAEELRQRGVRRDRVEIIPNGIADRATPRHSSEGAATLAIVGRLIREKNVHLALAAVRNLRPQWPALRVLVAGEGPYRAELERLTREFGLDEVVRFTGFTDDVPQLLAGADIFVMPSQTEGMPIALLEAMAAEMPIVATGVGGVPTVVRSEYEALLIPPDDQPALEEALGRVLGNSELRRELAIRARDRYRAEFTSDVMADRYVAFYAGLAKKLNESGGKA